MEYYLVPNNKSLRGSTAKQLSAWDNELDSQGSNISFAAYQLHDLRQVS